MIASPSAECSPVVPSYVWEPQQVRIGSDDIVGTGTLPDGPANVVGYASLATKMLGLKQRSWRRELCDQDAWVEAIVDRQVMYGAKGGARGKRPDTEHG